MCRDGLMESATANRIVSAKRSMAKALSYRLIIICLDFATVYFFTGTIRVALGFTVVSNIYTTLMYVLHERVWARIHWGIEATNASIR